MHAYRIERRRAALQEARTVPETLEPAEGEAIFALDLAAITANNVTYAVHNGPPLHYGRFFPATDDDWVVVPLWGFATATHCRSPHVSEGARFYGYWPSASQARLVPGRPRADGGFVDTAAHRQKLAAVYNSYRPAPASEADPLLALFQPLYGTAFVLDHYLAASPAGSRIVLTSASAKTALGTAFNLKQRGGLTLVGLTSPGNVEFVRKTGYYDEVLPYAAVETLDPAAPSILVDFAGNGALKARLHAHLAGLTASHIVGDTDWASPGTPPPTGPTPEFFFAPAVWEARAREIGPARFDAELAASLQAFLADTPRWLDLVRAEGEAGYAGAFNSLLAGRALASKGVVWTP
jgi:hypothetical protein